MTKKLIVGFLSCMLFGLFSLASDHKEAPIVEDVPPSDIADLYAFLDPGDATRLVLVLTINPFSVAVEAPAFRFSPKFRYRFLIDNNGDAIQEHSINFQFGEDQSFVAVFPGDLEIKGQATAPSLGTTPNPPNIVSQDNIQVFAGPRDDPFFFDFVGFSRVLSGTGSFSGKDSFAGFNVSAIAISMPVDLVSDGSNILNIWGVTDEFRFRGFKNKNEETVNNKGIPERFLFRQVDRAGNPGVATALIPSGLKDRYNIGRPENDGADFAGTIVATLQALGTNDENIGILASVAVPDVLTIDVSQPSGFPNGRLPEDDVIDTLFFFIFNQTPVSDDVDANDVAFLSSFPFLAPPWQPE